MLASAVYIAKILLCYAYLRLFQTGTKGGKCSGLNNAKICKVYGQSMSDAKKEKERLRKQQWRAALTPTSPPSSPPPKSTRNFLKVTV